MQRFLSYFLLMAISLVMTACNFNTKGEYPKTRSEMEEERIGKLTGDGIILYSPNKKAIKGKASGISVNKYLWGASLHVVHFMPISSIDPFAGTIMTDWYIEPGMTNERVKLSIFITSGELRSDSIRVTSFRQILQKGKWVDTASTVSFANRVEEEILLKARDLKIKGER